MKNRGARIGRRRVSTAALCAPGVVAAMLFHSVAAKAAEPVGIYVEGPDAGDVREALAGGAPKGVTVAGADEVHRALTGGNPVGLFANGKAHEAEVRRVREEATALGLDAVLLAVVRREGAKRRVRLIVIDRAGREEGLSDVVYQAGGDGGDADLASRAGEAFAPYAHSEGAAPEPAPQAAIDTKVSGEPGEPRDEGRDSNAPRPRGVYNRSLVALEVGGSAVGRQFDYHDGISANLRSYNVAPAAMASVAAEVFPFAGASGVLRDFGFTGSYAHSLFLKSTLAGGPDVSTTEAAYSFGLRARIHPWGDAGTLFGVSYQYADQSFVFDSAGASVDAQLPSVDYRANRIGADVRIPFGSFALLAGAAFRAVLSAGDVQSRFRAPSVDGVDGEVGASMTVASGWEARLVADYERYFYGFQPMPGDGYVAGGALDQFFGGRLAVAYVY